MSDTSARRTEPPIVVSIISTKGGVGKTTTAANLGGFLADAGMRVLLLDLDIQPTLSSYFPLERRAPGGIYEMLAFNEQDRGQLISTTAIGGLDLLLSNDAHGQLNTLLLHAADGRLRLRNLLGMFRAHYDLLLIDTQGARSVLLEMAVLASDVSLSPVTPEILAARELRRGTLSLMEEIAPYRRLGIEPRPCACSSIGSTRCRSMPGKSSRRCAACSSRPRTCGFSTPRSRRSRPIPPRRCAACRCIASSTGSRVAGSLRQRWRASARSRSNCFRSGATASTS